MALPTSGRDCGPSAFVSAFLSEHGSEDLVALWQTPEVQAGFLALLSATPTDALDARVGFACLEEPLLFHRVAHFVGVVSALCPVSRSICEACVAVRARFPVITQQFYFTVRAWNSGSYFESADRFRPSSLGDRKKVVRYDSATDTWEDLPSLRYERDDLVSVGNVVFGIMGPGDFQNLNT